MKALDAFIAVQHEMDKFASPSFEVVQFNHFFNSGLQEYLTENYGRYDVIQKDVDDIRTIVKSDTLAVSSGKATLPNDYRHALKVKINGTFNKKVGRYPNGTTILISKVERALSGEEGYRAVNHYLKPSHRSAYFSMEGGFLIPDAGPDVNISSVVLQYVNVPPTIYLSPNDGDDLNVEQNNTTLPFPLHVNYELIKKCARIFLENIESTRYPMKLQEQQFKAE